MTVKRIHNSITDQPQGEHPGRDKKNRYDDRWKKPAVAAQLGRRFSNHLAHLSIDATHGGKAHTSLFTGFLYAYDKIPFWVTAGHALKRIQEDQSRDGFKLKSISLIDGFKKAGANSIPITFEECPGAFIDEDGIDFGFMLLSPRVAKLLHANPRAFFLDSRGWPPPEHVQVDGFYLVGTPEEYQVKRIAHPRPNWIETSIACPIICRPVERLPFTSVTHLTDLAKNPDAFYGRVEFYDIPELPTQKSIVGMSGGPILSIERGRDGKPVYRLVGIQSSWIAEKRILRATPMSFLDAVLSAGMEMAAQSRADGDESPLLPG